MKKNLKVSIIVPIYNVEKYLDRCLNSIVNQTYKNIEIILVDDGSKDNCPKKCDEWAKKDNRIIVYHKENAGLGMARNSGIELATGDYICFVDSDDIIDLNTIETVLDNKYDIICYGYKRIDSDDNIFERNIPTPPKDVFCNEEIYNELLPNLIIDLPNSTKFNLCFSSCMCLISLDIIKKNNWSFVSERDIISEDLYSLMNLYRYVKSVKIVSKDFYSYRINNNSLTRTYKEDRFFRIKKLYFELLKLYSDDKINDRVHYLFLSYSISCLKLIVESKLKFSVKLENMKEIINDSDFRCICKRFKNNDSFIRKIYIRFILLKMKYVVYFLTYLQIKKK